MISIIIPAFNSSKTIGRCLKSVFGQTLKDFEVIVVDDGSKDNLRSALRPWQTRVKFFQQENGGAPAARNRGFRESRGEFVIFCDADVIMRPDMLNQMHEALLKNRQTAFAYSSFRFGFKKFKLWEFDKKKLREMPYIHTTSLIRREAFPGFDQSLKRFQDWDLFLTISKKGGEGIWINKILYQVQTGGTMSRWMPKFFYKLPWLKRVQEYKEAEQIIKKKHRL